MESLSWHIRLIDRMVKTNPEATIADYFRLTDGYRAEVENLEESIKTVEREIKKLKRSA